jgi:hypothetical protein
MRVVAEGHQYPKYVLEMETGSHATELRVYTAKGDSITGTGIWLPVGNNLINQIVDLGGCKSISRAIAQTS